MKSNLAGKNITMLGCDERELLLAERLDDLNVNLRLVGFPRCGNLKRATHFSNPGEAVTNSRALILPMSGTDSQGLITSRMDGERELIDLNRIMPVLNKDTPILIGVANPVIKQLIIKYRLRLVEMAKDDEIAIFNAIPTAEGAIQVAMENSPITIHNSKCLVLGLGRCGAALTQRLVALGAHVTVGARTTSDLARAVSFNARSLHLKRLNDETNFKIIFNTIPAVVLERAYLQRINTDTLIVDLASTPGGTDFIAAKELGISAIHALSLPGKVAPKTAGEILSRTIPLLLEKLVGEEEDDHER